METEQTNKLGTGTWANLPTKDEPLKPQVKFDIDVERDLILLGEPRELDLGDGAFYIFDVEEYVKKDQKMEQKVLMTSAITLLKQLKKLSPIDNTRVKITKVMEKGKQIFKVNPEPKEEDIQEES